MFCFHKWGKVEKGYQYCSKCGLAKIVECNHVWKEINLGTYNMTIFGKELDGDYYFRELKCTKCGEMKVFDIRKEMPI